MDVIRDVRKNFDYSQGVHEILLSGAVGSAKSLLAVHIGLTHCLMNKQARICLCRRAMPDLKETIFQDFVDHMGEQLVEGEDYSINWTKAEIDFANGSQVISRSWADKKYKKFRSVKLSAAIVEELTENDQKDKQAVVELKARVNRLPHIDEKWIIYCTNPDSPSHWAYDYFDMKNNPPPGRS